MPDTPGNAQILPTAELRRNTPRPFLLEPDAAGRASLAVELGAQQIRKLRFEGVLRPEGKAGWQLDAKLGATVVQACIVTLEPVTTRIDAPVTRLFLPAAQIESPDPGSEVEVPEGEDAEPLGSQIDLGAIMAEALSLAMPAYPRKEGAALGSVTHAEEGLAALEDADLKPFAALGALKDKLSKPDAGD